MVKNEEKERILSCLEGQQTIESCLHMSLLEHLNTEINLRTVKCQKTALIWMKSTFLYIRVQKDPKKYGLKIQPESSDSVDEFLVNIVAQNFSRLERLELVKKSISTRHNQEKFANTTLGSIMAIKAIKFKTMELLLR